ncbi:hypothetical protein H310_15178, partial [Aphanomyces invadans]
MSDLCEQFGVTRQAMSRISKLGQQTKASTGCADVKSRKPGNCGRRPMHTLSQLEDTPGRRDWNLHVNPVEAASGREDAQTNKPTQADAVAKPLGAAFGVCP